jgi:hypothetical protein
LIEKRCKWCEKKFTANHATAIYCQPNCSSAAAGYKRKRYELLGRALEESVKYLPESVQKLERLLEALENDISCELLEFKAKRGGV